MNNDPDKGMLIDSIKDSRDGSWLEASITSQLVCFKSVMLLGDGHQLKVSDSLVRIQEV